MSHSWDHWRTERDPKYYKRCAVPLCNNNTNITPEKLFIYVPFNEERRKQWFRLAGINKSLAATKLYYCEDHFDMPNDMSNFMEYHLTGSVPKIRMKLGCLPSKFDCQPNRKPVSDMSKPSTDNRQTESLIEDCIKDEDQNQDIVDEKYDEGNEETIGCLDKLKASEMMEVIDLDCDDTVTSNNEIQSGINTEERKVNVTSKCNPDTKSEMASEEKTEDKQANLMPGSNSSLNLDKFKRRLIRFVARSLIIEKKPENTFWKELKKVTSCDCQLLWTRMRAVTIKKLKRLFAVEDKSQHITKIARLTVTDWLLIDLVLVHEKVDVIGQEDDDDGKDKKEPMSLEYLFILVLKHNIEMLSGDKLTEAWFNVAKDYNKRGRFCSPMLLQRRWYQLKELVWYTIYNFWFSYRGDSRNLDNAAHFKPNALQLEIIKHFSKIVTEQFQTWEELIEQKKVVLLEDFERYELELKKGTNIGQENEPDLVVIEPNVDIIDLRLEPDSDNDNAFDTNKSDKIPGNSKINLSIVKNETIDEISDADDVSMLEAVNIPFQSLKPLNITKHENIDKDVIKNDNVFNINVNTTINDSAKVIRDTDTEVIDNDDENALILNDSDEATTPLAIKHTLKKQAESGRNLVELKNSSILDVDVNRSYETSDNYINSAENCDYHNETLRKITTVKDCYIESKQNYQNKEESVIQNIQGIKIEETTKLHQDTTDIRNVQGLLTNLISDIKKGTLNISEKQNMNILYDVTSNIGVYMNGLELEDDGIEYFEEDDDDDVTETNIENNVEEDCTTDNKNPPKIDHKLLLQTVVYTKRLNDMNIFRFLDYNSVKDARIINEAIIESLPVHKKIFKTEDISECQNEYKSDRSDCGLSNYDECEERINYNSWYFKKPKISSYNPIQLCKNPDFNTRLKKLTAGFFSAEKNRRLLKECKPLTIDIYKSFENKLNNNKMLLDGFPSQTIKKEVIEPNPEPVERTVLPTENLINIENVIGASKQCISKVSDLLNQKKEVNTQIIGRNRIINLPDIEQIRRANEKLLIAEVTPIQVSSTSNKPPVEILQDTASIQSIKEQDCEKKDINKILNIEKSLPLNKDIINIDTPQTNIAQEGYNIRILEPEERIDLEIESSKECEPCGVNIKKHITILTQPKPPKNQKTQVKPPPTKKIREFVKKGVPTDRLLALDTIERILRVCENNVDPIKVTEKKIKNKSIILRRSFLRKTQYCRQNKKNDKETGNVKDISVENDDIVGKEIPVKIPDKECFAGTPILVGGNVMENINEFTNINPGKKGKKWKKKKLPRSVYCCWAREKTVSLSNPRRRRLSTHKCPLPLCSCCCKEDYLKALSKLRPQRQDSLSGLPQIFISTAVNNGISDEKQSCQPFKIVVDEKVSRGINTDDNPEYTLDLREASKISFNTANKDLLEQNLLIQNCYISSETPLSNNVSQVQQTQTKDTHVNITSDLSPIITSVQSLSHTQPIELEDVEQTNNNKTNTPSSVTCKTNLLFSERPSYLMPSNKQNTKVPLSQLTVIVPDSKSFLLNKKLNKTPNPISLGKNKILLCSKWSKEEAKKQTNEPIPPQLVILNNDYKTSLEGVNLMLPPSQLTVNPAKTDPQNLKSISTSNTISEQEITNNISNSTVASCNVRQNVNNENHNVDNIKAAEEIEHVRSDKNKEYKNKNTTSSSSDTLTQSKFAIDRNIKYRERVTKNSELDKNVTTDTTVSPTKLNTIENDKTSKKMESVPHKSTNGSTKKTILLDLMEMSGISLEDTTVNSESTELEGNGVRVSNSNTAEKEISNISPNPDHSANINTNLNIVINDQFGKLCLDLNVVSSLYDLKQACDKNKQFYKMNLETGQIIPINVSIKKHIKPKSKPILHNTVIDLTDDWEKEKDTTSDSPPDEKKQSKVVKPLKLYRAVHPTLVRASGKTILKNSLTCKGGLLQKKQINLTTLLKQKRKEQTTDVEIQGNKGFFKVYYKNVKPANVLSSDSDDEPLAFKAKRKKNYDDDHHVINTEDKNKTEVTETVGSSASTTDINEPEVNLTSVNHVLEPVVFDDSSDEICILGV